MRLWIFVIVDDMYLYIDNNNNNKFIREKKIRCSRSRVSMILSFIHSLSHWSIHSFIFLYVNLIDGNFFSIILIASFSFSLFSNFMCILLVYSWWLKKLKNFMIPINAIQIFFFRMKIMFFFLFKFLGKKINFLIIRMNSVKKTANNDDDKFFSLSLHRLFRIFNHPKIYIFSFKIAFKLWGWILLTFIANRLSSSIRLAFAFFFFWSNDDCIYDCVNHGDDDDDGNGKMILEMLHCSS